MNMKKDTQAPKATPALKGKSTRDKNPHDQFADAMYQRSVFLNMALSMSWKLAIVVLVPIVGGSELDQRFHKSPFFTILGLAIAVLGIILVLMNVVAEANKRTNVNSRGTK
jgi:F0F1-type ATP synthase assembly protein I